MCALVQPVPDVIELLQKCYRQAILTDAASFRLLQQEVPVLFTLLENLPHYPKDLLEPVIHRLITVSLAPFSSDSTPADAHPPSENALAFFPS